MTCLRSRLVQTFSPLPGGKPAVTGNFFFRRFVEFRVVVRYVRSASRFSLSRFTGRIADILFAFYAFFRRLRVHAFPSESFHRVTAILTPLIVRVWPVNFSGYNFSTHMRVVLVGTVCDFGLSNAWFGFFSFLVRSSDLFLNQNILIHVSGRLYLNRAASNRSQL